MTCGIYCIKNLTNNKVYIGQSVHIEKRLTEHEYELRNYCHHNFYLQNSWEKHGEQSFDFFIIEECSREELDEKESFYVREYDSRNPQNGYNLTNGGKGNFFEDGDKYNNHLPTFKGTLNLNGFWVFYFIYENHVFLFDWKRRSESTVALERDLTIISLGLDMELNFPNRREVIEYLKDSYGQYKINTEEGKRRTGYERLTFAQARKMGMNI
jgi:hypothetical protein